MTTNIVKITAAGKVTDYAPGGPGELDGPIPTEGFGSIRGIAIDAAGTLYITDKNRVRKIGWQ